MMRCGPTLKYPPLKVVGVGWNGYKTFFLSYLGNVVRNSATMDALIKEYLHGI